MTYHGPSLVAWLREQGVKDEHLTPAQLGWLRRWREGSQVKEDKLDRLLCDRGLHLDDVPLWVQLGWPARAVEGLVRHPRYPGTLIRVEAA